MSTIQVNLQFNADTKKAKQQIQDLQNSLDKAISSSMEGKNLGISPKLDQARQSAMQLKIALESATNVDTGKLNLNKFMGSMNSAGLSIKQLATNMRALGPEGVNAFNQMAQAVASAETKIFSLEGGMRRLANTFMNTMRYQASAAAINAVSSSIRDTISFTKDLDKALTNIRMVTGASANQMAKFAKTANDSARALSTTTQKYAEASLIYFQQGLNEAEVKKRADTTIKLANAVGTSAEEASNWMTAIWNNFDDGSESLEYYADVLAKLGAATASSADEIATGLEKFAAIADTVGLSYEYAAAALATVTAETRQSADVVGTAFKTIFSRMEGLKLGETLDDGTTLNQYSSALASVGVNIKGANGELKEMDTILDETAQRWQLLSKDQQIALAQSVAGVRQYTQFIALMDNYDVMQNNIKMAKEAEGALQSMYDGYVDSIEGMQQRATAEAEKLKMALLGSNDMKDFYKALGDATKWISGLVNSFGGLKGILITVASLLTKIYQPQITKFFQQSAYAIADFGSKIKNSFTGQGWKSDRQENYKKQIIEQAGQMEYGQEGGQASAGVAKKIAEAQSVLAEQSSKMTKEQIDFYNWQIKILETQKEKIRQQGIELEQLEQINAEKSDQIKNQYEEYQKQQKGTGQKGELKTTGSGIEASMQELRNSEGSKDNTSIANTLLAQLGKAKEQMRSLGAEVEKIDFEGAAAALNAFADGQLDDLDMLEQKIKNIQQEIEKVSTPSLDTEYIEVRGKATGEMLHGSERALGIAKEAKKTGLDLTSEQRVSMADKMQSAIITTQKRAEDLGVEIEDNGAYAELTAKIEEFKNNGIADIDELIKKIEQYNEAVKKAGSQAIQDTTENAIAGSLDQTKQGFNEINTANLGQGKDEGITAQANNMIAGIEKVEQGTGKQIKSKGADKTQKEKLKSLVEERKKIKDLIKEKKQDLQSDKKSRKEKKALKKELDAQYKALKKNEKQIEDTMKETQQLAKAEEKSAKTVEGFDDALKDQGKSINDAAKEQTELGKKQAEVASTAEDEADAINDLTNRMQGGGDKAKTFADALAGGLSSAMQIVSGISMISNGVEELSYKLASGEASWSDWLNAAMAVIPGMLQLVGPIMNVVGAIAAKIAMRKASKKASDEESKQEQQDAMENVGSAVIEGTGEVAKNVAKGYAFWPVAIAGAAALALVGAAIALPAMKKGKEKADTEEKQKNVEKGLENLELIDELQEESKAVNDLTAEYKALQEAGESTYETMKQLEEQIPNLIDKYKELEKATGIDLNTKELEAAYRYFQETGDISWYEQEQAEIDSQVDAAELDIAKSTSEDATTLAIRGAQGKNKKGGEYNGSKGTYTLAVGTSKKNQKIADIIIKNVPGAKRGSKDNHIIFKMGSATELIDTYEGMGKALKEIEAAGYGKGDKAYDRLYAEYTQLGENMPQVYETQGQIADEAGTSWETDGYADQIAKEVFGVDSFDDVKLSQYTEEQRNQILDKLQEHYDITREQAEQLLMKGDTADLEIASALFGDGGKIANELEQVGNSALLDPLKELYDSLNAEDKLLFTGIDFTQIDNLADVYDKLAELREKSAENKIISEAGELGYDENTFRTYSDLLVDTNEHLTENNATSKQIALNNLKLNKGLATLADSWGEISEVLNDGKRGTIEYAEALGKIKTAFEEAFGYVPSTKFIEENLDNIKKLAEGDVSALQELQDELAKDYIANMEIGTSINEDVGFTVDEVRNKLNEIINSIDTSLEIGEGTELSDDYLNSLQAMLDNGQITADQLQGLMRAKGFELEITGWKKVPGPEKTITQEISGTVNGQSYKETKVITEKEDFEVPIINGDTTGIISGTGGKATLKKSSGASAINQSTLDKNSGGGGGGEKEKKNLEDEIERYYELEKTLERLNKEYDRISTAKDRAFGKKRLKYLEQEITKTQQLADVTKQKLREAEEYLAKDRANLMQFGASFNQYGEITNYEELIAAQVEAYNTNPEGQEENYTKFQEYLSQYQETLDLVQDLNTEIENYTNQVIDSQLEGIQYQIEVEIQIPDAWLSLIEFQLEMLEDNVLDTAKKFDLMASSIEQSMKKMSVNMNGIKEIFNLSDLSLEAILNNPDQISTLLQGKDLTAEQISLLEEFVGQLQSEISTMRDLREEVSDNLVTAFEDMNEEMEKHISQIDHLNSMIDSYRNIIDLAGREALGINADLIKQMAQSQYQIANSNIQTIRAKYEQNVAALASIEKSLQEARKIEGNEAAVKEFEEAYEEMQETIRDNQQELLDATSAGLEAATALFEEEMNNILNSFEDAMTGIYGTFATLQEAFNQYTEIDERYLDDYQKIYELSKLNRDLINSIDETDNIKAKERLRDLQEEINALQESNTVMTQYEVNELRARYELRLAEIALEEAQNAKSQVRMQRDAEGNWGYVYTADENAIGKAEQGYEDSLYAYQQNVQGNINELQARLIQIPQEYTDAIRAIYEDQTLNDEERRERIKETQEYYADMYSFVVSQLKLSNEHSATLYSTDWLQYSKMTGYKISKNEEWIDDFNETIASQVLGLDDLEQAELNFQNASENMLDDLANSYSDYRTNIRTTLDLCLDDMDQFLGLDGSEGGLKFYLDMATQEAAEAAEAAEQVGQKNAEAFEEATNAATSWLIEYSKKIDEWTAATLEIATSVTTVIDSYADLDTQLESTIALLDEISQKASSLPDINTGGGSGSGGSGGSYFPPDPEGNEKTLVITGDTAHRVVNGTTYVAADGSQRNSTGKWYKLSDLGSGVTQNGATTYTFDSGVRMYTTKYLNTPQINSNIEIPRGLKLYQFSNITDSSKLTGWPGAVSNSMLNYNTQRTTLANISSPLKRKLDANGDGIVDYIHADHLYNGAIPLFVKASDLPQYEFDTGGYTGSWDASGRLAWLHQKEIVLNAHDTENFLAGINVLRDITSAIDLQALSQAHLLSSLTSASVGTAAQVIEQEVTIHAEFPNAVNHNEIEEAFNSLLNHASQFANRKN